MSSSAGSSGASSPSPEEEKERISKKYASGSLDDHVGEALAFFSAQEEAGYVQVLWYPVLLQPTGEQGETQLVWNKSFLVFHLAGQDPQADTKLIESVQALPLLPSGTGIHPYSRTELWVDHLGSSDSIMEVLEKLGQGSYGVVSDVVLELRPYNRTVERKEVKAVVKVSPVKKATMALARLDPEAFLEKLAQGSASIEAAISCALNLLHAPGFTVFYGALLARVRPNDIRSMIFQEKLAGSFATVLRKLKIYTYHVVPFVYQVLFSMGVANHHMGFVHRDLSTRNIMLREAAADGRDDGVLLNLVVFSADGGVTGLRQLPLALGVAKIIDFGGAYLRVPCSEGEVVLDGDNFFRALLASQTSWCTLYREIYHAVRNIASLRRALPRPRDVEARLRDHAQEASEQSASSMLMFLMSVYRDISLNPKMDRAEQVKSLRFLTELSPLASLLAVAEGVYKGPFPWKTVVHFLSYILPGVVSPEEDRTALSLLTSLAAQNVFRRAAGDLFIFQDWDGEREEGVTYALNLAAQ